MLFFFLLSLLVDNLLIIAIFFLIIAYLMFAPVSILLPRHKSRHAFSLIVGLFADERFPDIADFFVELIDPAEDVIIPLLHFIFLDDQPHRFVFLHLL